MPLIVFKALLIMLLTLTIGGRDPAMVVLYTHPLLRTAEFKVARKCLGGSVALRGTSDCTSATIGHL